jgi:hypothetical protein
MWSHVFFEKHHSHLLETFVTSSHESAIVRTAWSVDVGALVELNQSYRLVTSSTSSHKSSAVRTARSIDVGAPC